MGDADKSYAVRRFAGSNCVPASTGYLAGQQMRHTPQPIVSLITQLLEKDPAARPQTPEELLTRSVGAPKCLFPGQSRFFTCLRQAYGPIEDT